MNRWIAFTALIILLLPASAPAEVIHVPAGQPTIQAGIDAASDGDTVLVADGTYTGPGNRDIDFSGKEVTVVSENGRDFCTIDCEGDYGKVVHRAFLLTSGEGPGALVQGFTIMNGYTESEWDCGGGAILCSGSSPRILDNAFLHNLTDENGGAICCGDSTLVMGNYFHANWADGNGGAVFVDAGSPVVANNFFHQNSASIGGGGGVSCSGADSAPLVINNLFVENQHNGGSADYGGGAISTYYYASPTVVNCTFYENNSFIYGDSVFQDDTADLQMKNCILWGGSHEVGYLYNPPLIEYSVVQGGYPGTGNLAGDPDFVTGPAGDYYLSRTSAGQPENSPCRNAGSAPVESICWTADGQLYCLDQFTTRTDEIRDAGTVDIGFHYPARSSVDTSFTCSPASSTLPFGCQMMVSLANRYPETTRRLAARINVDLAGGQSYSSWRAGYTNIAGGGVFLNSWVQNIPALPSLLGDSYFTLTAEDVTPAPYNQPPYLSSGDTGSAVCQVTGIAP